VILKLGKLERAWLVGDMAAGKNSELIEIVLIGDEMDASYLAQLVEKVETLINKKIKTYAIQPDVEDQHLSVKQNQLLLWSREC